MSSRNYLSEVILPIYKPYLNTNMLICICDQNGVVQFTTELWNNERYSPGQRDWQGISISDYQQMEEISTPSLANANRIIIDYNSKAKQINEAILLSKRGVLFVETNFPLLDQDSNYIGTKHITREVLMPNMSIVLRDLDKKYDLGAHLLIGKNDLAQKMPII